MGLSRSLIFLNRIAVVFITSSTFIIPIGEGGLIVHVGN